MAALDFPASPTPGQTYSAPNGIVYVWDNDKLLWLTQGPAVTGAVGDFYVTHNGTSLTSTPATIIFNNVQAGNSGSHYSVSTGRFTPPAGRYVLSCGIAGTPSGASNIFVRVRKNGVDIPNALMTNNNTVASWNDSATVQCIVDANGTDWFDVQGNVTVTTTCWAWFLGYPLTGVQGPPGPPGQLGWRLLKRVAMTAGLTEVSFAGSDIPSDINDVKFVVANALPQTNDVPLILRLYDSAGVVDAGANYSAPAAAPNTTVAVGGNTPQTNLGSGTGFALSYNAATNQVGNSAANGGISVEGTIMGLRTGAQRHHMTFQSAYVNSANTAFFALSGGGQWINSTTIIAGLRFLFAGSNFAAGGSIALWGSP